MEYVTEKAGLYELNKKVKSWERKVDIAEVRNDIFYHPDTYSDSKSIRSLRIQTIWLQANCKHE